jgi:hypothetical protein
MAINKTTAFNVATTRGVKMTVYGRGGVGKTMLGLTLPPPIAYGSVESGMLSLSQANQLRVFGPAWTPVDAEIFELEDLNDLITFHEWMSMEDCPYNSIVLDTVTSVADKVLANALLQVKDPRQAYGELMKQMIDVFWRFRDMKGKHVLFIAEEMPNKEGNVPLHVPTMPGNKLAAKVPYLFDELFHMEVGKTPEGSSYRFLQTQPSLQYDAKDRSGALAEIEEPNLSNVIAKIVS